MKHVFVTNDFPPKTGGIESYLVELCRGFDPADVTVVAPARAGHAEVDARLPYEVVRLKGGYLRASRRVEQAVIRTVRTTRADVVHFLHALPLGRLGRKVRKRTDVPYTVVAHGAEVLLPARVPGVRRVLRKTLTSADLVLPVSEYTKGAVEKIAGTAVRTAVVPPAVNANRFSLSVSGTPVRERYKLGSRFVVLFVSRLVKRKGAETLVRAVERLDGATALIVGSGPEDASLKRLVEELELKDRVVFAGHVPEAEKPSFYAAADLFCMPCTDRYGGVDTEGFGIVYLEAQACGLPCIAGSCGGSVEAVLDGQTGVVLPDASPRALAKTIAELRADPVRRATLGAAGRARVEEGFTPKAQAERLERAVEKLLAD